MQRFKLSLVALVLLIDCTAWGAAPPPPAVPNELPRSWSLDEIGRATPPYDAAGRVFVLAWKVIEDDCAFRVESCLVLKAPASDDGHGQWCLAHLYRHPADKKPRWHLSLIHVTGSRGTMYYPGTWLFQDKSFKQRPTNKAIYSSLGSEEVGWSFDLDRGWKFVGCGVCEKSWQAAIGEKPSRYFGRR